MKKLLTLFVLILCIRGLSQDKAGLLIRGGIFIPNNGMGARAAFDLSFHPPSKSGGHIGAGVGYLQTKDYSVIPVFGQIGYAGRTKKINPVFTGNMGYAIINKRSERLGYVTNLSGGFYASAAGGVQLRSQSNSGVTFQAGYTTYQTKATVNNSKPVKNFVGGPVILIGFKLN